MAQYTIPDWARSSGRPVDLRTSPYWGPQQSGDGMVTVGNGDGSGYYPPLNQFAAQYGSLVNPSMTAQPNPGGAMDWLGSTGQQLYEASDGSQNARWLQDANGNITAEPQIGSLNDRAFGTAAALAGGLISGNVAGLWGGGAGAAEGGLGTLGTIAPGSGQLGTAIGATGLEATAPMIAGGIPSAGGMAAGGLGAGALGGGAMGGGAGGFSTGMIGGAAPSTAGFSIPSFASAAGGGMDTAALWKSGIGLAGNLASNYMQGQAQQNAAGIQADAARQGQQTMRDIYAQVQQQLAPYTQAGTGALQGQQALIGLGGPTAQQQAIAALQQSPEFQALTKQGEDAILANASATGGLRGGNVQSALGQFRPQVLAQLINQQYSRLGGLTSLGQNSAAGVGDAARQTGTGAANLQQQAGAAQAGGALSQGRTNAGYVDAIFDALGLYRGLTGG